jgi:GDP-L-fucose synthase
MPIRIRQNVNFDWLYISDLMKIVEHFIDHDSPDRAYNITPGRPLDLVTIADMINKNSAFPSEIIIEIAGLNNEYSGNNDRLLTRIGNFPFTPMQRAISELREYYSSILSRIDADAIWRDEYARYCIVHTST